MNTKKLINALYGISGRLQGMHDVAVDKGTPEEAEALDEARWLVGSVLVRIAAGMQLSEAINIGARNYNDSPLGNAIAALAEGTPIAALAEGTHLAESREDDAARFRWIDECARSIDVLQAPNNTITVWCDTGSGSQIAGSSLREVVDKARKHDAQG